MFYCLNCQSRFDTPELEQWGNAITNVCPHCRDNDYIRLKPCAQCSEPKEDNGDKYCEECKNFTYKEISHFVQHLTIEGNYDRELVIEMMEKYIEDN